MPALTGANHKGEKDMLKRILFVAFTAVCASAAFALTPMPRCVSQAKLDKYMADYEKLQKSGVLEQEWNNALMQVNSKYLQEPGVAEDIGEAPLNMSFILFTKTAEKVKKSGAANAELAKFKWGPEYWDVFLAVTFSLQYSQMAESSARAAEANSDSDEDQDLPVMKPITYYMDKQDYALILQNKDKIGESMQTHSGFSAG